jgi:hypothetical protein
MTMTRFAPLFAIAMACTQQSSVPPDGNPHPAPDAPPAKSFTVNGTVVDLSSQNALANANTCFVGDGPKACTTTAADGSWTLQAPEPAATTNLAQFATVEGYLGEVYLAQITVNANGVFGAFLSGFDLHDDASAKTLLATNAGFKYPDLNNGFLQLRVLGDNVGTVSGATATISSPSAAGPVYIGADGTPDPTLTATVTDGFILFGNVPPGMVTITVTAPGRTCTVAPHGQLVAGNWPPSSGGTGTALIVAGAMTDRIHAYCE